MKTIRTSPSNRCAAEAMGSPSGLLSALVLTFAMGACDELGATPGPAEPLALKVTALTGTACGDPDAPAPNPDPFADAPRITVAVRAFDSTDGVWETLVKRSTDLRSGQPVRLTRVPEGTGREVIVHAQGASQQWYGRASGLSVLRNADNAASMLLTRFGGVSCVPSPEGMQNTVFPAAVTLGDGRILVSGGFLKVVSDGSGTRLSNASNQAFLFDSRTGQTELLGSFGTNEGRAGHAAVYLEETNKVVLIGGMTELQIDQSQPFPYVYDPARGRDDYVIFDVATKTFAPGGERMVAKRGFPRAASLNDGTVLITGGGKWPFDPAGTDQIRADIFDPFDNDEAGGLLDIPPMRSFYWRAGHSLTRMDESVEGLTSLLLWGGTTADRSLGHPAEIYRQSGRQREGVNGTFSEVVMTGEVPPFSYFHETVALSGGRFLVTGGSRFANGALQAPENDDAWLLTFNSQPVPALQSRRIAGMGSGRVFHSALSSDQATASLVGGWSPINAATDVIRTFDLATTTWADAGVPTAARGGHAAVLTAAGSIFLVGGESAATAVVEGKRMAAEVYAPSTLPVP